MQKDFRRLFRLNRIVPTSVLLLILAGCASARVQSKLPPSEQARLYLEAAVAAQNEGDSTSALAYLLEAESRDPSMAEIHHLRGIAYFAKKELALAEESVTKALQLRPDYPEAQTTLGKLLLDSGRLAESEKWLRKSASNVLYRDAFKARTSLGILFYRRGDFGQARQELERAVTLDPARACVAHYYIGHLDMRDSRFDSALVSYERSTQKFCAGFAEGHLASAVALERTRDLDRARRKYLEVTRSFPNTVVAEQARSNLKRLP